MPRARLASFDDCTISVTSPHDDIEASSDVNMALSITHPRNYSDGDKLIETKPDPHAGDYNPEHTYECPNTPDSLHTNLFVEAETWLAPFHDYDFPHDLDNSLFQQDLMTSSTSQDVMTSSPSQDPRHDADRTQHQSPRDRLFDAAVMVHTVVKLTRVQRLKKRARWLTKKVIVFVLSHVGLTSLVGLYAVAGGFIFQRLERNMGFVSGEPSMVHRGVAVKGEPPLAYTGAAGRGNFTHMDNTTFEALRLQHVEDLWNLTLSLNVLEPDTWKKMASSDLQQFERDIYKAILKLERDVTLPGLPAATTAGLAPAETPSPATTTAGLAPAETPSPATTTAGLAPAETHSQAVTTDWTYSSALLFAVTVITTIGYGDTVPRSWEAKIVCIVYAVFGIPLTLLCLANIGSLLASVYRFSWKHASHLALIIVRAPERNKPLVRTSQVRVPVWVSLMTMIVYILGGAAIFSEWENWTFLEGSYFCFITLSTIGFGDYVPGKDTETLDSNVKRVVCALYLLFGLALLSMIFQLIQDSVTIVVGRYASFLGLSEAQIERDIREPDVTAERKAETATGLVHTEKDDTQNDVITDERVRGLYPVNVSDHRDSGVLMDRLHGRFDDAARRVYDFNRVRSVPTHRIAKSGDRHATRLCSVPEESHLRDVISRGSDRARASMDAAFQTHDHNSELNGMCRKYSLPSVVVGKQTLQD